MFYFFKLFNIYLGFFGGSDGKESACNVGDMGSIPGLGRSPGGGNGNRLQYSCLENPHGQRGLVGYSPWGCKELDTTERLSTAHILFKIFTYWPHWVFTVVCGLTLIATGRGYSLVVSHGLSCSEACGIFPAQGSNWCSLHCKADS